MVRLEMVQRSFGENFEDGLIWERQFPIPKWSVSTKCSRTSEVFQTLEFIRSYESGA